MREIQKRGLRKKERIRGRIKRGEKGGERSIVSFIPAFQNTPDYFSRCLYCDNVLIVVHFWKIARHECAFKIAGVSGSSSPPILRDPLCRDFMRRSAGNRRDTQHRPGFSFSCSPLSFSLFKELSSIF